MHICLYSDTSFFVFLRCPCGYRLTQRVVALIQLSRVGSSPCGETHLSHAVFEHVQFIRTVCSQAHSLTTRTRVAQGQQGSSRLLWCVRKMSSQRHISSFAALVTEHFYTFSPSQSHSLVKDPRTCADPRRSGGSIEIPSPTGRTQTPNSTYRAVIQAW